MGFILLPILLGAAVLSLICIVRIFSWVVHRELDWKVVVLAVLISSGIYFLAVFSFYLEGELYVMAPYFRLTFAMFYIPFIVCQVLKIRGIAPTFMKAVTLSVVLSALVAVIFYEPFFDISGLLNLPVYH